MKTTETLERKEPLTLDVPEAQNEQQEALIQALCFLLYQFPSEFAEANHQMLFPQSQGFSGEKEWHIGNIFQRSLIADTLIDCNSWMKGQLDPLIAHEMDFLTSSRRTDGVGGWGYFPDLIELPPDADDLGQMIQLYTRTQDRESFKLYCEPLLDEIFQNNRHTDGGFESWIIPVKNLSDDQKIQLEWAQEAWGTGADTEVVSNLLYALIINNPKKYTSIIKKGTEFLWNKQEENGSWLSTWYFGPYYGTYTALRVCLFSNPDLEKIGKIEEYLKSTQLQSGGWGLSIFSDPLQTSFALLSLSLISEYKKEPIDPDVLENALNFLLRSQMSNGSWQKTSFIKMEMGRPRGFVHNTLEYGSKTITTTFAIKALHQLLKSTF